MAQYKIFAEQGRFSDFQLKSSDQSDQINRETQRQLRGKEAVQRFTEQNQQVLDQLRRQTQTDQEIQRDKNFKAETEARRAHQKQEQDNYRTQVKNDNNAAAARQRNLKDLSAFSESAFKIYGAVEQAKTRSEISFKHKLALDSGLDLEDLKALSSIETKLDRSQFNQLEFIRQKIEDGGTPAQINALYEVFKRSGSNQWYEISSLYQNSVIGHKAAQNELLKDMMKDGASPTVDQISAKLASYNVSYIENRFPNARPEILESSGVYKTIRNNTNTLINSFSAQSNKNREEEVKDSFIKSLNTSFFTNRDTNTVLNELRTNPSADMRKNVLGWAEQSVLSGSISIDEATAILDGKITVGNNDTSISEQYNGFPEVASLAEAIRVQRNRNNDNISRELNNEKLSVNAEAQKILNDELEQTGGISKQTREDVTEFLKIKGGDQAVLEPYSYYSNNVQASRYVNNQWDARFEKSGTLPTLDELNNLTRLDAATRNKWLGLINQREKNSVAIKGAEKAIEDQVKAAPQIQALGSATASGTVAMMQTRMTQLFKKRLRTMDLDAARALTVKDIQDIQAGANAFDAKGNYASIMSELATDAARGKVELKALENSLAVIVKQPRNRRDFKALSTAMGASTIFDNIDNINSGRPTTAIFKRVASELSLSPYELGQILSKANNIAEVKPKIPKWENIVQQTIQSNKGKRLRNTYRETIERTTRANALDNRSGQTAPVRSTFSNGSDVSKFRAAIINKESGGNYTIVNPDSGAIGIGQVMPENVGPWTQKYLGKTLTPEEFRYNPGAQDAVVNGRFKDMLADQQAAGYTGELMIRRAASVWYSGNPDLWNNTRQQQTNGVSYPSIADYTQSIWNMFQSSN